MQTKSTHPRRLLFSPLLALALLSSSACADAPVDDGVFEPIEGVESLSESDRLVRVAMALKGTRPSVEEIRAVQADPAALPGFVDEYLDSPLFGETVQDVENQTLLVRIESPGGGRPAGYEDMHWVEWSRLYYAEPLKLIEYVVLNDRPYSEIVTMDKTMLSAGTSKLWGGIEDGFDPDGPEWQLLGFTDGRPTAGILSTGAYTRKNASGPRNYHRQGAAAAANSLICTSYFDQDIPLGTVDLTDSNAVDEAIMDNPACVSCHQTLDPMAGFFQGYATRPQFGSGVPVMLWDPSVQDEGEQKTGRANGYYGLGGDDMVDLGELIASDNRFTACTARRYISYLSQIPIDDVLVSEIAEAQRVLIDSDMSIKAMVRSIVLSARFAQSHSSDDETAEEVVGYLQTRPEQMSRMFEELTGFHWEIQLGGDGPGSTIVDLPTSSHHGFKVHGGGLDNGVKIIPVFDSSAHASAFLQNLAAEVAGYIVVADFEADATERKLMTLVDADTVDEAKIREQLAFIHLRVLAEDLAPDSADIDDSYALFSTLYAETNDIVLTWKIVLTALFQDFRIAYH